MYISQWLIVSEIKTNLVAHFDTLTDSVKIMWYIV